MATYIDFAGFSFNGYHSSELNFYRVSNGDRYSDDIIPSFQDKTVQITGGDGTLYWDSFYTQKQITIQIAFDSMTEANYRTMREVFSAKTIGRLIFDEAPYKYYNAKVQKPPQLKTLCFVEGGERVYKGEGTIQFVCYDPYAHSVYKFLGDYSDNDYPTKSEWKGASGMKDEQGSYDGTGSPIYLFNSGDIPTDFCAYFAVDSSGSTLTQIALTQGVVTKGALAFSDIIQQSDNDSYIRINSRTNLVEGCDSVFNLTGTLYNKFITAGDFFKIPLGESELSCNGVGCQKIEYDYLYY